MVKKVVLAVVLVLLLIGAYILIKGGSDSPQTSQISTASSLKDLISKGIAQSCTFTSEGNKGTVYVSGEKVRNDFETTIDGRVTKSHMIVDGKTSYIWTDGQSTGFKMTFESSATPSTEVADVPETGGFDSSANMDYKCKTWMVDNSQFALPPGVQFTSFGGSTSGPASQCSYCDSLTGDSKSQCLTSLKCN